MQCSEHQDNRRAHTPSRITTAYIALVTLRCCANMAQSTWTFHFPFAQRTFSVFSSKCTHCLQCFAQSRISSGHISLSVHVCGPAYRLVEQQSSVVSSRWAVTSLMEVEVWLLGSAGVEAQAVVAVWVVCSSKWSPWSRPPHHVFNFGDWNPRILWVW